MVFFCANFLFFAITTKQYNNTEKTLLTIYTLLTVRTLLTLLQ